MYWYPETGIAVRLLPVLQSHFRILILYNIPQDVWHPGKAGCADKHLLKVRQNKWYLRLESHRRKQSLQFVAGA